MNLDAYRETLQNREQELAKGLARVHDEVLQASGPDAQDETDRVTGSEQKATLLQRNSLEFQTLVLVREALARIEAGTYGKCLACGGPIEEKRLEAIPWAAYDREHQEQQDRETGRDLGGAGL